MKGKVILKPNSITLIAVKTPRIPNTNIMYGVDSKFQIPEGIMPLDMLHRVDHKMPRELNIHIFNTSSSSIPHFQHQLTYTRWNWNRGSQTGSRPIRNKWVSKTTVTRDSATDQSPVISRYQRCTWNSNPWCWHSWRS